MNDFNKNNINAGFKRIF